MRRAVVWSGGSERTPRRRDYVARMRTPKTQTAGLSLENWRLQCTQNATLGHGSFVRVLVILRQRYSFLHVYLIIRLQWTLHSAVKKSLLHTCMHTKTAFTKLYLLDALLIVLR